MTQFASDLVFEESTGVQFEPEQEPQIVAFAVVAGAVGVGVAGDVDVEQSLAFDGIVAGLAESPHRHGTVAAFVAVLVVPELGPSSGFGVY